MKQRFLIPLTAVAILVVVFVVGAMTQSAPVPVSVLSPLEEIDTPETIDEKEVVKKRIDRSLAQRDVQESTALDAATRDTEAFSPENYEQTLAIQAEPTPVVTPEEEITAVVEEPVEEEPDEAAEEVEEKPAPQAKSTPKKKKKIVREEVEVAPAVQEMQESTFVVVGGGQYSASVPVGSTVQAAMNAAGIPYTIKPFAGLGAYVTSVDGIAEDTQAGLYWILYIDGAPATVGISSAQAGSTMTWRLERGR